MLGSIKTRNFRGLLSWRIALALGLLLMPAMLRAEPTWWKRPAPEAAALAKQTNRWIVLYFETEKADDCVRMNTETWPNIDAAKADQQYIWMRLKPETDPNFFKFFEIFQTPEIVVVDAETQERARLKGFTEPQTLLELLKEAYKPDSKNKLIMTNDGTILTEEEYKKAVEENRAANMGKHFWYESFDSFSSLERLDPKRFDPYVRTAMAIEANAGKYHSPALFVSSDFRTRTVMVRNPASAIRINLNEGAEGKMLNKMELVEGKVRVTLSVRANRMPDKPTECASLIVYKRGDKPTSKSAKVYTTTISGKDKLWQERFIETEKVNFKQDAFQLHLWVEDIQQSFYVDDIRVDLLSPDASLAQSTTETTIDPAKMLALAEKEKRDWRFEGIDVNKDTRIEKREVEANSEAWNFLFRGKQFEHLDFNRDGYIDYDEFKVGTKK